MKELTELTRNKDSKVHSVSLSTNILGGTNVPNNIFNFNPSSDVGMDPFDSTSNSDKVGIFRCTFLGA
jgi:hypothetical protein